MTETFRAVAMALCLALTLGGPAAAESPGERLFFEGALRDLAIGATIVYEHRRGGTSATEATQSIDDGEVRVQASLSDEGARQARIAFSRDGKQNQRQSFPASIGNPLLMIFLESNLRSMATITGGSSFYIRNRIKEALRSGGRIARVKASYQGATVDAEEIVFRPFIEDKNRDKMGEFGELELRFLLSPSVPGGFLLFSASTPERQGGAFAFREEIAFHNVEEAG